MSITSEDVNNSRVILANAQFAALSKGSDFVEPGSGAFLDPRGSMLPFLPKEVISDRVRHWVSHVTGHTLGLRHHF